MTGKTLDNKHTATLKIENKKKKFNRNLCRPEILPLLKKGAVGSLEAQFFWAAHEARLSVQSLRPAPRKEPQGTLHSSECLRLNPRPACWSVRAGKGENLTSPTRLVKFVGIQST